jgi:hypothetical protein
LKIINEKGGYDGEEFLKQRYFLYLDLLEWEQQIIKNNDENIPPGSIHSQCLIF